MDTEKEVPIAAAHPARRAALTLILSSAAFIVVLYAGHLLAQQAELAMWAVFVSAAFRLLHLGLLWWLPAAVAVKGVHCAASIYFALLGFWRGWEALPGSLESEAWRHAVQASALGYTAHCLLCYHQSAPNSDTRKSYAVACHCYLTPLICAGAAWYPAQTARALCSGVTVPGHYVVQYMYRTQAHCVYPWAFAAVLVVLLSTHARYRLDAYAVLLFDAVREGTWPLVPPLLVFTVVNSYLFVRIASSALTALIWAAKGRTAPPPS
jgi:hypothetical protein